jgi:hypothetical protein
VSRSCTANSGRGHEGGMTGISEKKLRVLYRIITDSLATARVMPEEDVKAEIDGKCNAKEMGGSFIKT